MATPPATTQYVRIWHDGIARFGRLDASGQQIALLTREPWLASPPPESGPQTSPTTVALATAQLLPPVAPTKVVCVGRNYRAHAAELGHAVPKQPLLFLKPPSSLLACNGVVELPSTSVSNRVEHEVELAVVVGKRLRRAAPDECETAVFGLTVAGDITARDLQRADKTWTRGKGMDTFCPVGRHITCGLAWRGVGLRCWVNGMLRQAGNTDAMIFGVPELLAFISDFMTLEPGDLVLTGTPEGVGPLAAGDHLRMEAEGIAELDVSIAGWQG